MLYVHEHFKPNGFLYNEKKQNLWKLSLFVTTNNVINFGTDIVPLKLFMFQRFINNKPFVQRFNVWLGQKKVSELQSWRCPVAVSQDWKTKTFYLENLPKNGSNVFFRTKHKNVNISSTYSSGEDYVFYVFCKMSIFTKRKKKSIKKEKNVTGESKLNNNVISLLTL